MQVNVVLGFHNEATEAYNVTAIMGSLNSPTDFAIHVQNFTQQVQLSGSGGCMARLCT